MSPLRESGVVCCKGQGITLRIYYRVADARLWRALEEVAEKEELAANSSAGPWICISDVVANAPLPLLNKAAKFISSVYSRVWLTR